MENYFSELYLRDILKLRDEIAAFKDEDNIWRQMDGISNSAGTLTLHLVGNLNYTIGAMLGKTGYVRNRVEEFSLTGVPQTKLIADIELLAEVVKESLKDISQQKLDEQYPLDFFGQKSTAFYMLQFYGHLTYHLGQINYLRRILEAV